MERWVVCNKCFRPLKSSTRDFLVTSCQHIFCNNCGAEAAKRCPECSSVGVSTMVIQTPLQPALVPFFRPLIEQMELVHRAVDFQWSQARIKLRSFCEMEVKYKTLKKFYDQALVKKKELDTRYEELCEKLKRQQAKPATLIQAPKGLRACTSAQKHSILSSCREQLTAQRAAEREILPEGINRPSARSNYPMVQTQSSNRQPCARKNVTFACHEYQPRAIVSPESSVTPVLQQSQWRGVNSRYSSLNVSSYGGTPEVRNYRYNYTPHFLPQQTAIFKERCSIKRV